MNAIDLIVCLVLALAVWNGWRQGFVVQVCSLAGVVAGIWLAAHYGGRVGAWLELDGEFAAAVAVAARLVRRLCRFAGLGIADILLGVAVSVLKYLLILSALFSAFDKLNADYTLVGPRTVGQSKCYEPVLRLSEAVFPFLEWVGDRVPQRDE